MPHATTAQPLFAELNTRPGLLVVRLVGPQIGQREVPIITDLVKPAIEQSSSSLRFLVLDFSAITFMNSMGLGMCIDLRNRAQAAGAKSIIMGATGELTNLFKMVRLDKLYTFVKDPADLAKVTG